MKKTDLKELTFCIPVRIDSEYRLRNLLGSYSQPLYLMCSYYSVGGAFLVDVEEYRRCGWENEHFAGWGPEDAERYRRLLILGEQHSRIAGSLYHLYHTRGVNSGDYDKKLAMDTKKEYVHVKTIADLGCGPGWYVAMLRRNGYDVQGYDGNPAVEEMSSLFFEDGFYCQNVDLTEELEAEEPFDMVMSLEVGEHIPEQWESVYIDNLTRNARSHILLSWAVEGQPGDGHVNCHSNEYIINQMKDRGFTYNCPASRYLRKSASLWWFKNTIMLFERR